MVLNTFSPIPELDLLYDKKGQYPFAAENKVDGIQWQKECRRALGETIGFLDTPKVEFKPKIFPEVDRGDFTHQRIIISTAKGAEMPFYILRPKRREQEKLPVVLAYHGHGPGVKEIIGLDEMGEIRQTPPGYQKDFAVELCRRGFFVAAPEIACFGERQHNYSVLPGQSPPTTCHNAATYAIMLGKSVLGMRVRDSMRLLDYITTLPEVDKERIGVMGISGGGMLALFHACLDQRIAVTVLSGYFGRFRHNILNLHHCTCNFVPGLLKIGELDDLVGLLAPRPLLVEAGKKDPIFPIASVRDSIHRTREVYEVFECDPFESVILHEFDGIHEISGEKSYDFLVEQLQA